MNNVIDEILQDEPKYRILDSEGNILYDNISIEMITAIAQIGTALNKALFDSIKTDLDSRLPISYKASQSQAETGTDNTNYMTALRVSQFYNNKIKTGTFTWNASSDVSVNVGFTPKIVIALSNADWDNLGHTDGRTINSIMLGNVGTMFSTSVQDSKGVYSQTRQAFWESPMTSNGFTVKRLTYLDQNEISNLVSSYVAIG